MNLPRTDLCDPKCWMCFLYGECPYKKLVEDLMKKIPEHKLEANMITLENKGVNSQKRTFLAEIDV
jgi:hypothetical protein